MASEAGHLRWPYIYFAYSTTPPSPHVRPPVVFLVISTHTLTPARPNGVLLLAVFHTLTRRCLARTIGEYTFTV